MAKRKQPSGVAAVSPVPIADRPRRHSTTGPHSGHVARQASKPPHCQPSRGGHSTATNPNDNPDILDGVSALRASPDSGDDVGAPRLKPRVDKPSRTGQPTDIGADAGASTATLAKTHATTEVIAAPSAGQLEHGNDRQADGSTLGGGATNEALKELGLSSETTAADLPSQQPGRNKRKRHVKVDSAESNNHALNIPEMHVTRKTIGEAATIEADVGALIDPEDQDAPKAEDEVEDAEEVKEALSRPPPVNSGFLPLPWEGRLGYACLNTYLRNANPPVFSSRTCRIASILEHRHPLKDPSQPEHPTKNRPDKDKPADVGRGQRYVQELGLANARDIIKMVRWNDKYGIKFMRLSSEMFPFASHDEYGYRLEPFAGETLAEVGKVVAELGHRVTTHPGQFTQLGSPRKEVITASIRDLDYHSEMLSLLKLPPQQDRDAVMILHLGGAFGDKPATLDRFRENYASLSQPVKNRLVLENDDVIWSVHDLLPLCQELNIPFVLDFHHHNIIFDSNKIREGTKDIIELFPAIIETWTRKGITPKMHYSEPCPTAVTGRDRRKHSPRVSTLPPCPVTMDLMIEAKDKEQAVFELMRTFKLPGFDLFNDVIPHVRQDENRPVKTKPKKLATRGKRKKVHDLDDLETKIEEAEAEEKVPVLVPGDEVGMGGPQRRVYWPPGQEDWLRAPKRIVKKKEEGANTPAKKKRKTTAAAGASLNGEVNGAAETAAPLKKATSKKAASSTKKTAPKAAPTPSPSEDEGDSSPLSDLGDDEEDAPIAKKRAARPAPSRTRASRGGRVSYKEDADEMTL
ncbi:UV-endonuclease UvdE [Melanomma pulvis-pyrius CBS 109.77]|uniref:UV-endonuclease UvdE n=1 Tax=Melanomma pulvis-pyrius CBS 109.77 TaxID=1314802 RepID=A0A6A6WQQ2_9PLEO|nr:UV-endonuclease UvdE [Melanomma pulvis-pyrius CBS 109.77]